MFQRSTLHDSLSTRDKLRRGTAWRVFFLSSFLSVIAYILIAPGLPQLLSIRIVLLIFGLPVILGASVLSFPGSNRYRSQGWRSWIAFAIFRFFYGWGRPGSWAALSMFLLSGPQAAACWSGSPVRRAKIADCD